METLDRVTISSEDYRIDLEEGELKIGPDYACVYIAGAAENVLPNWDVEGHSLVASRAGEVHYTGTVVGRSVHDGSRSSRTTLRCKPAESHDG